MDDLIHRQAAIEEIARRDTTDGTVKVYGGREVIEILQQLPSAQPEIIRCKDCKWWTKQKDSLQGRCALFGMYPTGEWYCANAKIEVEQI